MTADWDIDSYKSEFENEEHWELKKNFMLAHKDKFPEDELVCLAQVFSNIEFMGCRYPDKTMIRVAELAKGVVEKFREQRKNSLKRTFVAASDAASAKVKGQVAKGEEQVSAKKSKQTSDLEKKSNDNIGNKLNVEKPNKFNSSKESTTDLTNQIELSKQSKFTPPEDTKEEPAKQTTTDQPKQTKFEGSSVKIPKYGGVKTFNIKPVEKSSSHTSNPPASQVQKQLKMPGKSNGPLGNFVLILGYGDEHPVSIIQRNASLNKCTINYKFEETPNCEYDCKLTLNGHLIASSHGANIKSSKEHTAMVAIAELRKKYYGIRVKSRFNSDTTISPSQLGCSSKGPEASKIGEGNVGMKLMKLMGWQGGGLGNKEQGREEPVDAQLHVRRDGLGLNATNPNMFEFQKKATDFILTWMKSNSNKDLVFSTDFNTAERRELHGIAAKLSLKSKSYGKDTNRQIVISRKYEPWEILKELIESGGNSDKYELLQPTDT